MKTILLTHQKGGVGKTTLCFNLAMNLAKEAKVCVLDTDYQGSLINLKEVISDFEITTDVSVLNSDKYDFLFIDTPPYLSDQLPGLIQKSDVIIVPTKAGVLDVMAIQSTISLIEQNNALDKALVVLNMIKPNTTLTNEVKSQIKVTIANTMINDLVVFTRSVLTSGVQQSKKAQRLLDKLTKEVLVKLIK